MSCGKKTRHTSRIGCCPVCHELFNSDTSFERHRTRLDESGRRSCLPPAECGLIARPSKSAPGEFIWGGPSGDNPWARSA